MPHAGNQSWPSCARMMSRNSFRHAYSCIATDNPSRVFSARLNEAGVKHLVLDGRMSQRRRGELARLFKRGCPRAVDEGLIDRASEYPVLLAGQECMAELHSFNYCNNVILTAYSWAFDKFERFINRAHRLNSPWQVNVWSVSATVQLTAGWKADS